MITAMKVYGIPETLKAFDELPKRMRVKHLRIALNAAAGLIRDAAKARVRRESGLLAASLKTKVAIPDASYNVKHHGKPAYAVIGPARNVVGPVLNGKVLSVRKATKHVLSGGKVETRRPSRYAHLIERGHGGPRPAPAYPFLGPAVAASKEQALSRAVEKLRSGLEQEAAALAVA